MTAWLQLFLTMAATLTLSWCVARLVTRRRPAEARTLGLEPGHRLHLVTAGGSYRCTYLDDSRAGLKVSAPLSRDVYVPLRVGETVVAQCPVSEGLVTFRTEVIDRDAETHTFVLRRPGAFRRTDRRTEPRIALDRFVTINGHEASLVNASLHGLCVRTWERFSPGDWVEVSLGQGSPVACGWILATAPSSMDGRPSADVRLRLDGQLSLRV